MQAPPVFSQVPPPPQKKTPWGVIAALALTGVLVAGGLFAALVFLVMKLPERSPPERPGFGHPVMIRHLDGTRGLYELPEVPMRLELPSPPKVYKFHWTVKTAGGVTSWIGYRFRSKDATFTLSGTWYRNPERIDLDRSAKHLLESYTPDRGFERFTGKIYKTKVGALDGREIRASYRYQKQDRVVRLFLWGEGDHTFYLSMHAYWQNRDEGRWEQDEILKSIEFR